MTLLSCDHLWSGTELGLESSLPALRSQFSQAAYYLKVVLAHGIASSAGMAALWVLPSPGGAFGLFRVGASGAISEGRCVNMASSWGW